MKPTNMFTFTKADLRMRINKRKSNVKYFINIYLKTCAFSRNGKAPTTPAKKIEVVIYHAISAA